MLVKVSSQKKVPSVAPNKDEILPLFAKSAPLVTAAERVGMYEVA